MTGPTNTRILIACLALAACRTERGEVVLAHRSAEPQSASTATGVGGARLAAADVVVRRLWASSYVDFYASSISADGRYMSMIDWSTSNLAVRDLETGMLHRLTETAGRANGRYQDAGVSLFSRDGRSIVYGWQVTPPYVLQLRVMDMRINGAGAPVAGEPRILFNNPAFEPYYPFDWSPDGSLIVAKAYTAGNTNVLSLISTADGTQKTLRSFDWRQPERAAFSPDGRYIAYDFQPDPESANRDLFVVSVDGAHETRIAAGPAYERLLGWHPDGSIFFTSNRGGTPGIWRIPLSDGRASGPPAQLLADTWGVEPLGFAGDRFYYGLEVDPPRLQTTVVDFENERMSTPVAIEHQARLGARGWDWSPDGQYLAWSAGAPTGSVIVIQSADGQNVRSIPIDLGRTRRLQWHPDGKSILAYTTNPKGRRGFFRIDLANGSYTPVVYNDALAMPVGPTGIFALSPDGNIVYFAAQSGPSGNSLKLVAHDLRSAASVPISVSVDVGGWLAISPDGRRLAVAFQNPATGRPAFGVVPVSGGEVTAAFDAPGRLTGLEWTPDGHAIVFLTSTTDANSFDEVRLWKVPIDGGKPHSVKLPAQVRPQVLSLHPDGRRVTFLAGESRGEVWVMEGLGSKHASGQDRGTK